jgi:hypothetical protein
VREHIDPPPGWAESYAQGYARFRSLYPVIRSLEEE